MSLAAFQELIDGLAPYFDVSKKIGGAVAEQADFFKQAVDQEKEFLAKAVTQKKPNEADLGALLTPISTLMGKISEVESKYRGKDHTNHLKTVSEGTQALAWVSVEPTPGPFVKEALSASQFWSNRILKEFKGKDESQVNWANAFSEFLTNLQKYILQYHTTGVAWNSGGGAAASPAPTAGIASASASETDFANLISDFVVPFVAASEKIGGAVLDQAKLFKRAVDLQLDLIKQAAAQKKPSTDEIQKLIAPISEVMGQIAEMESKYKGKDFVNHLKTVAEGTPALGWVVVEPTPGPYAKEMIAASDFWSIRVLKEFKGKDENHVAWATHFNGFLKALATYITSHHTTGLSWNTGAGRAAAAAPVATGGGNAEREFKSLIEEHIDVYVKESEAIGGAVLDQAKVFKKAIELELELIAKAAAQKKATPEAFQAMIQPISDLMGQVGEMESKYRGKDFVNHLKTVSEGVAALGWVCVEPTPGPYAKEVIGASEFWSNKILKEFKGKDEKHVNWVKGFSGFLKALVPYILANHTTGLSWNTVKAGPAAAGPAPAASSEGAKKAFEDLLSEYLNPYIDYSNQIGGEVATQANLFKEAALKSAELIGKAATTKKPSADEFQAMLTPISNLMGQVADVESKYKGRDWVNHLKTVAEGTPALGWLCVEPTPGPYAKEYIGASEFWANKILSQYKGKDDKHVNWVNSFVGFLKELPKYIVSYHTTGLSWSKK